MKVYFSASRFYRDKFREVYKLIADQLQDQGYEVFDRANVDPAIEPKKVSEKEKIQLHKDFVKALDLSDFSIFEASYPSTIHIGHEITIAIQKGKPVVVLYGCEGDKEPLMFKGLGGEKVIWVEYDLSNLKPRLQKAIEKAKKMQDVRFNFFVSPKHLEYLDWVAKKKMIPRAVFLRDLIEKEIKKDREYTKTE